MIYMRNITITTAKSATYLENVGSEVQAAGFDEIVKGQRWAFTLKAGQDGRMSATDLEVIA